MGRNENGRNATGTLAPESKKCGQKSKQCGQESKQCGSHRDLTIYDFGKIIDRQGTLACKTDQMPKGCPPDSVSAWIADMDFACPQPVTSALHERVNHGIFGYTVYESKPYLDAVTGWFARRFGWNIDPAHIVFSPGVVPAISVLVQALTEPGDGIVIQKPVYYPFMSAIQANGRKVVNNPLVRRNRDCEDSQCFDYVMDYAGLEQALADDSVRGMILCSPHNPAGRVWTRRELQQVLEICQRHGKWIICDEIHCDLTRNGTIHTPLLKLAEELCPDFCEKIITCTAPTKTFNLAGLSISNIIIPGREFRQKWEKTAVDQLDLFMGNPLSMTAAMAAYDDGENWLDQLRSYLDGNIAFIRQFVRDHIPEAAVADCQGTYLVWIDLRAYCSMQSGGGEQKPEGGKPDYRKLKQAMQQVGHLALDEGYIFGEEGQGYERINVAMPRSLVEEAMKRMEKAVRWLEEEHEG